MRFVLFLTTMLIAEIAVGHASIVWYIIGFLAMIIIRPFGGTTSQTRPPVDRPAVANNNVEIGEADEPPSLPVAPAHSSRRRRAVDASRPQDSDSSMRHASRTTGKVLLATMAGAFVIGTIASASKCGHGPSPIVTGTEAGTKPEADTVEKIAGNVWKPEDCEERYFPQLTNEAALQTYGSSPAWQIRTAQAHAFCGHEWQTSRIASAAKLLEQNGMLYTQWNREAIQAQQNTFGSEKASIYDFSPDVANFFKVLDAGALLVGDDVLLASMRAKNPTIPPDRVIQKVRRALQLETDYTTTDALPQVYTVNEQNPRVRLITDVGLANSLNNAIWQSVTVTFSHDVADSERFLKMLGASMTNRGNFMAAMPLMMLQTTVVQSDHERERLASAAHRTLEPLGDTDVYFLRKFPEDIQKELAERGASFDPKARAIYVLRTGQEGVTIDSVKLDVTPMIEGLLPAQLWHEFDHYVFDAVIASDSGFIREGVATALGEHERRSLEAGLAVPRDSPLFEDKRRLTEMLASGKASQADVDEFARKADVRIQQQPLTPMQCYFAALDDSEYVRKNRDIPIEQMLSLNQRMFQSESFGNVKLKYATAWAVFNMLLEEHSDMQSDFWQIAARLQASGQTNDEDRRFLKALSDRVKGSIRNINRRRSELCKENNTRALPAG